MGTRGSFGFQVNGTEYIGYNQFDSYPEGHGVDNLDWLRSVIDNGLEQSVREAAEAVRLVTDNDKPTPEDVANLEKSTNLQVSNQDTDDWYCLTRETHGNIGAMIECGYILDASDFPRDSLFCEWGYMVDFDKRQFEVYKGFNQGATEGRFADRTGSEKDYNPITLVAVYSFDELPSDENFLNDCAGRKCDDCGYRRREVTAQNTTCDYCVDSKTRV